MGAAIFAIFDVIFSLIFAVIKFILNILNWFGLTIPLFYFLFMLMLNYALGGVIYEQYNGWYWAGFITSFVLAAVYFFLSKFVFKKKKDFPKFDLKRKNKNQNQNQNAGDPLTPMGEILSERVFTDPNGNIIQERTYKMPDNLTVKTYPLDQQSASAPSVNIPPAQKNTVYGQPNLNIDTMQKKNLPSLEKTKRENSAPLIYRVKNNPEYILKEYPDRTEVYKETADGYKFIKVDYK